MAVILIVEDEIFVRELAGMFLQDWGHSALFAGSVEEALQVLKSAATIDALFTDIYLKKAVYGGCDLAREAMMLRIIPVSSICRSDVAIRANRIVILGMT